MCRALLMWRRSKRRWVLELVSEWVEVLKPRRRTAVVTLPDTREPEAHLAQPILRAATIPFVGQEALEAIHVRRASK
jgi:hypothetical protein